MNFTNINGIDDIIRDFLVGDDVYWRKIFNLKLLNKIKYSNHEKNIMVPLRRAFFKWEHYQRTWNDKFRREVLRDNLIEYIFENLTMYGIFLYMNSSFIMN